MAEEIKRYSGPATVRRSYMNRFSVECPKCRKEAEVSEGKLQCFSCNNIQLAVNFVRFNAIVKRNCDDCGKSFEVIIPNNKDKVIELALNCPNCGTLRVFEPRNEEYRLGYKNEGIGDPIFNLPLWFQSDIKGDLFWGYNREHLNEIRNYVSSMLRERQTTLHSTMVERLPNFVKAAKNRNTVIKAIDKLLEK